MSMSLFNESICQSRFLESDTLLKHVRWFGHIYLFSTHFPPICVIILCYLLSTIMLHVYIELSVLFYSLCMENQGYAYEVQGLCVYCITEYVYFHLFFLAVRWIR